MDVGTIAVSGGTGLVGSALLGDLAAGGAKVLRLARAGSGNGGAVLWDPPSGSFDARRLEGAGAIVHLAGEPIAARRWSSSVKERLRTSRLEGTRLLVSGLERLANPPRVLISASAIGYYGDRGEEDLDEASPAGGGFLANLCEQWEAEAARAAQRGIRVVRLRIGIVLSARGGALKKMLPPFRLGVGGRLGDGRQWMSWIHLSDLVGVIRWTLSRDEMSGPVNAVSPAPARNAEFTATLGRVLRRPVFLPAPAVAMRLALGEMADALLLSSQRVKPARLLESGYTYRFPALETTLRDLLVR